MTFQAIKEGNEDYNKQKIEDSVNLSTIAVYDYGRLGFTK